MVYKLSSSKEVIAKVFADLDMKEDLQRVSDMMEWISEAVEKIGAVSQLNRVVSGVDEAPYIQILNNQAQLPTNLFRLNYVAYGVSPSGPWIPATKTTSSFGTWPTVEAAARTGDRLIKDQVLISTVKSLYQKYAEDPIYAWFSKMDDAAALNILNTNANVRTILTNLINASSTASIGASSGVIKYALKPGYITTNIATGYLKLSYDELPMDENGYLLIPDLASYREALYWYVVMKLKFPEYMSGRMNREIYYDIRRSWNFYCQQAYAEAMMPDQGDMDIIHKSWIKLVPDLNMYGSAFDELANGQKLYNHN